MQATKAKGQRHQFRWSAKSRYEPTRAPEHLPAPMSIKRLWVGLQVCFYTPFLGGMHWGHTLPKKIYLNNSSDTGAPMSGSEFVNN